MDKTAIKLNENQFSAAKKAIATLLLPKNRSSMSEGKLFAACFNLTPPDYTASELERLPNILSAHCVSILIGSQWLGKYPKDTSANFISEKILNTVIAEPVDELFFMNCSAHSEEDIALYNKVMGTIVKSYCQ